jgi:hypothetical protein
MLRSLDVSAVKCCNSDKIDNPPKKKHQIKQISGKLQLQKELQKCQIFLSPTYIGSQLSVKQQAHGYRVQSCFAWKKSSSTPRPL